VRKLRSQRQPWAYVPDLLNQLMHLWTKQVYLLTRHFFWSTIRNLMGTSSSLKISEFDGHQKDALQVLLNQC
jgi:hypothetical protein